MIIQMKVIKKNVVIVCECRNCFIILKERNDKKQQENRLFLVNLDDGFLRKLYLFLNGDFINEFFVGR